MHVSSDVTCIETIKMSPLTVENCLLIKALLSAIRSWGGQIEHSFS